MKQLTRRQFIQSSAIAIGTLRVCSRAAGSESLPIGFSTLGCPGWNWLKILDFAQHNGFAAVELRGLQGTMDLPARLEFSSANIAESRKQVAARGLRISCVSSSANMHDTDPQKHAEQMADARRFIDLAHALGSPMSVFSETKLWVPETRLSSTLQTRCASLGTTPVHEMSRL